VSIYAYVGLPRSGKSYNVVANVILPALREGRRVVTNVPVYRDKILAMDGVKPAAELVEFPVAEVAQDPELIRKYVTPGTVFVLDEVWRLWPTGMKAIDIPEAYKSLLAEHGHMVDQQGNACHVVLVVQDLANIAVFARRLVEQTFLHTKMGHLGFEGRYRVTIYQASMTGVVGPEKNRLREIYGTYVKEVWDLYKSHTMSQAKLDGANEKGVDRRGNVLKKAAFVYGLPMTLIALVAAGWYLTKHVQAMTGHKPVEASNAALVHPGFAPAVAQPANSGVFGGVASAVASRTHYHLVGVIEVVAHPERSRAVFKGEVGAATVTRSMSHCRYIDGDYFECEIDGHWVGAAGESLTAHEGGALPISLPIEQQLNVPLVVAAPAVSVANEGGGKREGTVSASRVLAGAQGVVPLGGVP
jgi:zona occludens toxin (predicted ATPase)